MSGGFVAPSWSSSAGTRVCLLLWLRPCRLSLQNVMPSRSPPYARCTPAKARSGETPRSTAGCTRAQARAAGRRHKDPWVQALARPSIRGERSSSDSQSQPQPDVSPCFEAGRPPRQHETARPTRRGRRAVQHARLLPQMSEVGKDERGPLCPFPSEHCRRFGGPPRTRLADANASAARGRWRLGDQTTWRIPQTPAASSSPAATATFVTAAGTSLPRQSGHR